MVITGIKVTFSLICEYLLRKNSIIWEYKICNYKVFLARASF